MSSHALRVAAFTGGWTVPSARFRIRQYIPHLVPLGIQLDEFVSHPGAYPPAGRRGECLWAVSTLADRARAVLKARHCSMTVLQREMVSTFVTLEPLTRRPRVLDVDDAIWLRRQGHFARRLAQMCEAVICGNSFLAEAFGAWSRNVTTLPTAVDAERFCPSRDQGRDSDARIVCWSGISGGFEYIRRIEPALSAVLCKRPGRRLRVVSDHPPNFRALASELVEFIPWSPENEVSAIQDIDAGIMPLDDSLWSRGKCAYKMLTYMACGVPVVVSPIGMNAEILQQGDVGFGARTQDEWVDALDFLLSHPGQSRRMGMAGRQVVERDYSLRVLAPILARTLRKFAP